MFKIVVRKFKAIRFHVKCHQIKTICFVVLLSNKYPFYDKGNIWELRKRK